MSNSSVFQTLVMPPSVAWLADTESRADEDLHLALQELGFAVCSDMSAYFQNPSLYQGLEVVVCIHNQPVEGNTAATLRQSGLQVVEISLDKDTTQLAQTLEARGIRTCPVPMQNFDHDDELFHLTLQAILTESPGLLDQALEACEKAEIQDLRRLIHTLKGHTKLLGENALAGALQALEDRASRGELLTAEQEALLQDNLNVFFSRLRLIGQTH